MNRKLSKTHLQKKNHIDFTAQLSDNQFSMYNYKLINIEEASSTDDNMNMCYIRLCYKYQCHLDVVYVTNVCVCVWNLFSFS